jgi:hypothetical protein
VLDAITWIVSRRQVVLKCVNLRTCVYKAHGLRGDAGATGSEEAGESICGTGIIRK